MTKRGSRTALEFLADYGALQRSTRFHYVTIHPLADEPEILARLGMQPNDCIGADCYWALGRDVAFVGVLADPDAEPKASYHRGKRGPAYHHFTVVTRRSPLTSAIYESILEALEDWFLRNRSSLPPRYGIISREDLGERR